MDKSFFFLTNLLQLAHVCGTKSSAEELNSTHAGELSITLVAFHENGQREHLVECYLLDGRELAILLIVFGTKLQSLRDGRAFRIVERKRRLVDVQLHCPRRLLLGGSGKELDALQAHRLVEGNVQEHLLVGIAASQDPCIGDEQVCEWELVRDVQSERLFLVHEFVHQRWRSCHSFLNQTRMDSSLLESELRRKLNSSSTASPVLKSSSSSRRLEEELEAASSRVLRNTNIVESNGGSVNNGRSRLDQELESRVAGASRSTEPVPGVSRLDEELAKAKHSFNRRPATSSVATPSEPTTSPANPPSAPTRKFASELDRIVHDMTENKAVFKDKKVDRRVLDEADPLPPSSETLKLAALKAELDEYSSSEEEDEAKIKTYDDDDWDDTEQEEVSSEQLHVWMKLLHELRMWIESFEISLTPSRSLDQEIHSGILLCRLFAVVSGDDSILGDCQTDYSPALACLAEWNNIALFLDTVVKKHPVMNKFKCEVGDLHNKTNLPKVFAFLCAYARETGSSLVEDSVLDDISECVSSKDEAMIKSQSQLLLAKAYVSLDEEVMQSSSPVFTWLKGLNLDEYFSLFDRNGWDNLERVSLIEETDLQDMGISKRGHIKALLMAVRQLQLNFEWIGLGNEERYFEFQQTRGDEEEDQDGLPATPKDSSAQSLAEKVAVLKKKKKDLISGIKLKEKTPEAMKAPSLLAYRDSLILASRMADQLQLQSAINKPAIVLDFASDGYVWAGFAGSRVPAKRILIETEDNKEMSVRELVEFGIRKALEALLTSLNERKEHKIFVSGVSPTRAMLEFISKTCPDGMYVCGPKSTASLALRAVGLMDGVALDLDSSGMARVTAVRSGQAIPQGFTSGQVFRREGDAVREDALTGLVLSCLAECGFPSSAPHKRVRGGLVATGTQLRGAASLSKKFSAGLFCLEGFARWGIASQIASHPDFQHRWRKFMHEKNLDDQLFPLMSRKEREKLTNRAISISIALEKVVAMEEDRISMEQMNASNMSEQNFAHKLPKRPPPPRPQRPAPKARVPSDKQEYIDFEPLLEYLQELCPPAAFPEAKAFVLQEVAQNGNALLQLPWHEVIKRLPQEVRKQMGVIVLDTDDDDLDDSML